MRGLWHIEEYFLVLGVVWLEDDISADRTTTAVNEEPRVQKQGCEQFRQMQACLHLACSLKRGEKRNKVDLPELHGHSATMAA